MARIHVSNFQDEVGESNGRSLGWIVWVMMSLAALALLVAVLHMSDAIRGPEEAIYSATKNVPVVRSLTGWMHKEESAMPENLSPQEAVSAKDITNNLIRTQRKIDELESQNKELTAAVAALTEVVKKVDRLDKRFTEIEEYGGMAPAAAAPAAPGISATAAVSPAAAAAMVGSSGENYRLVSKIFEKIEPDTAVDILNNMTEAEQVKILGSMKEGTVAEILTAFDPIKSAQLTRMLAGASR